MAVTPTAPPQAGAPQLPASFQNVGLDPNTVAGMNTFMQQYLPQVVSSQALSGLGAGAQAEAAANAAAQAFTPLSQADLQARQQQEALGLQGTQLGLTAQQIQNQIQQQQQALNLQGIQTGLQGFGLQQQAGMNAANLGQQGFANLLSLFTPAALPRDVQLQQSSATENEIARLTNLAQNYILGPLSGAVIPTIGQTVTSSGGK
jgi:hypothetical protein